jgi:hypothetical protein
VSKFGARLTLAFESAASASLSTEGGRSGTRIFLQAEDGHWHRRIVGADVVAPELNAGRAQIPTSMPHAITEQAPHCHLV